MSFVGPLWSRLVEEGLLTEAEAQAARARQAAEGGAPDTAVLEVRPLDGRGRARLLRIAAGLTGRTVAPPEYLDRPEAAALGFVPEALCAQHPILPVHVSADTLTLVAPVLPDHVLSELAFSLGRRLEAALALELDVRAALMRHLGVPLPARFAALQGTLPAEPVEPPAELDPRPRPAFPERLGPEASAAPLAPAVDAGDWVQRALEALRAAPDPDRVRGLLSEAGHDALRARFYLARTDDGLRCVAGAADAGGRAPADVRVPVARGSALDRALRIGAAKAGRLADDPGIAELYHALGRALPAELMVEPIRDRYRIVGVLVGDHAGERIPNASIAAFRRLLAGVGPTLSTLLQSPAALPAVPTLVGPPAPPGEPPPPEVPPPLPGPAPLAAEHTPGTAERLRTVHLTPVEGSGRPESPTLPELAVVPLGQVPTDPPEGERPRFRALDESSDRLPALTPSPTGESARRRIVTLALPEDDDLPDLPSIRPRYRAEEDDLPHPDALRSYVGDLASRDEAVQQTAEAALLGAGEVALDVLVEQFPGHLLVDRYATDPASAPVSRHSGLLRTMLRFGPDAAPRLEALCEHLSPEIRYYAVFCFAELHSPRSLPRLSGCLFDKDASVREIAAHVIDRYREDPAFDDVVARIRRLIARGRPGERRAAAEAAGRLHAAGAALELAEALSDAHFPLVEAAHKALVEIARQDFGTDEWKWRRWFERNGQRPRVEWLIDGLMSDQRPIRAGAFRELLRLTHQNYGYLVDAPPADRRAAADRWARWWTETGHTRYARYS